MFPQPQKLKTDLKILNWTVFLEKRTGFPEKLDTETDCRILSSNGIF